MANITETSTWESNIYLLATSDLVLGGVGGASNTQPSQLANRTTKLRDELEKNGIFIDGTHAFMGQNLILDATFEGTVSDGDLVYRNTTFNRFDKALSDGSVTANVIGVADVTNTTVISNGLIEITGTGGSVGDYLYLDESTAGTITTTPTDVLIGKFMYDDIILLLDNTLKDVIIQDSITQKISGPVVENNVLADSNLSYCIDFSIQGDYVYAINNNTGKFNVIDITDPSNLTMISTLTDAVNLADAWGVEVQGNTAYVPTSVGLQVIDITDKTDPTIVATNLDVDNLDDTTNKFELSGKYGYFPSSAGNFTIVDLTNPLYPYKIGEVYDANLVNSIDLCVDGDYVYVATAGTTRNIVTIDVTDPENPSVVGSFYDAVRFYGATSINISGKHLFVTAYDADRFSIVDASDPLVLTNVGSLNSTTYCDGATDAVIAENYAYVVGSNSDNISILDISDLTTPVGVSVMTTSFNNPFRIELKGKDLFVSSTNDTSFASFHTNGNYFHSAQIGNIATSQLDVDGKAQVENLKVRNGLYVGSSGINTDGPLQGNNFTEDLFNDRIFIGATAGGYDSGSFSSVCIGKLTGNNSTNGGHVFVGHNAGLLQANGEYNTCIGESAGRSNATGAYNTYVGEWAGYGCTGGSNVIVGGETFNTTTSGGCNSVLGYTAGYNATAGNCCLIGFQAGYSTEVALTAVGYASGNSNTTGANNTFVGYGSGNSNVSGGNNTFLGRQSGLDNISADNCTLVGYRAGALGVTTVSQDEVTYIGAGAGENTIGDYNVYVGYNAGQNSSGDFESTIIGHRAGENASGGGGQNVLIGNATGLNNTGAQQVCIGNYAGGVSTVSTGLVAVGFQSGLLHTSGQFCTYLGWQAGKTNATGNENTFIGYKAGTLATGPDNTFLGYNTGSSVAAGARNVMIGSECGVNITTGVNNVLIGQYVAGDSTATALSGCCIIGKEAYGEGTGDYSVMMGMWAGYYCESEGAVGIGHQSAGSTDSAGMTAEGITCVGFDSGRRITTANYSTVVGYQALGHASVGVTGDGNTCMGWQSMYNNISGEYNEAFGKGSMNLSTGSYNSVVGSNAGFQISGTYNCAFGRGSLGSEGGVALSGTRNIGMGPFSMQYATISDDTVAIGYESFGSGVLTGNKNIGIGYQTGYAATSANNNVMIGYQAGYDLVGGASNILIGSYAGELITGGSLNTIIGRSAGNALTSQTGIVSIGYLSANVFTGTTSTFIGSYAGQNATSANNSVAIGYEAMGLGITTGNDNIAIGYQAGYDLVGGESNILIGSLAGSNISVGNNNIILGNSAGHYLTTANQCVIIGDMAGNALTTSLTDLHTLVGYYSGNNVGTTVGEGVIYNTALGYKSLANGNGGSDISIGEGLYDPGGYNVAIGSFAGYEIDGNKNTFLGHKAGYNATTTDESVVIGYEAMGNGITTGNYNHCIGYRAGYELTSGADSILIGQSAGTGITSAQGTIAIGTGAISNGTLTIGENFNTAIGHYAGADLADGIGNIFMGYYAGFNATGTSMDYNIAIGHEAMGLGVAIDSHNTCIGYRTGYDLVGGAGNILMGQNTGTNITTGNRNVCIGSEAGALGTFAGGNDNVYIGTSAGNDNIGGDSNIGIGNGAGSSITTGINNICLGTGAGASVTIGDHNILIGAGVDASTDDLLKLKIGYGSVLQIDSRMSVGQYFRLPQVYGNTVTTPRTCYIQSDGELGGLSSVKAHKMNINSFSDSQSDWLLDIDTKTFQRRKRIDIIDPETQARTFEWSDEPINENLYEEGWIAEEVQEIKPELTYTDEDGNLLGIEYGMAVPAMQHKIKQLWEQNKSYETIISQLMDRVEALENK